MDQIATSAGLSHTEPPPALLGGCFACISGTGAVACTSDYCTLPTNSWHPMRAFQLVRQNVKSGCTLSCVVVWACPRLSPSWQGVRGHYAFERGRDPERNQCFFSKLSLRLQALGIDPTVLFCSFFVITLAIVTAFQKNGYVKVLNHTFSVGYYNFVCECKTLIVINSF